MMLISCVYRRFPQRLENDADSGRVKVESYRAAAVFRRET